MARHKVYRAINVTKREVYHGVSENIEKRKQEHCSGSTKSLEHWDCGNDKIIFKEISSHNKQSNASKKAHSLENAYKHHKGFKNIKTRGI
jgi:predicted GIY-YIG superfamily endonuclease